MMDKDPLDSLLREWQAPAPPPGLDARMLAAYRQSARRHFLRLRSILPAPALAVLALILMALLLQFRPQAPLPRIRGYVTRIESAGFQPLPNGAARVVPRSEVRQ